MNEIHQAIQKHYPQHSMTLDGPVNIQNIPQFLNKVFHELGYDKISVNNEQAHQIFEIMDQNGDKVVSKDQIERGLIQILLSHGVEKHKQTWSNVTEPANSRTQRPQAKLEEQQLLYLFEKYDSKKTGHLNKDQLVEFVNEYLKLRGKSTQFQSGQAEMLSGWIAKDHKIDANQLWKLYNQRLEELK